MMRSRAEIKANAKAAFQGRYGLSVGVYALFAAIVGAISGASYGAAAFILTPAFITGYIVFCIKCYQRGDARLGDLFDAGFKRFGRVLGGTLWMQLFLFLWSLLFLVPGIIKGLAYSQTSFILANEPNVRARSAVKLSMRMTKGHKGEIFVWALSFIGWQLLAGLTFGVLGVLWVGPYINTSYAGLYLELRAEALRTGAVTQAMLDGVEEPE